MSWVGEGCGVSVRQKGDGEGAHTVSFLEGRAKSSQGLAQQSKPSTWVPEGMCSVCRSQGLTGWSSFSWETRRTVRRNGRCPRRSGSNWPR